MQLSSQAVQRHWCANISLTGPVRKGENADFHIHIYMCEQFSAAPMQGQCTQKASHRNTICIVQQRQQCLQCSSTVSWVWVRMDIFLKWTSTGGMGTARMQCVEHLYLCKKTRPRQGGLPKGRKSVLCILRTEMKQV